MKSDFEIVTEKLEELGAALHESLTNETETAEPDMQLDLWNVNGRALIVIGHSDGQCGLYNFVGKSGDPVENDLEFIENLMLSGDEEFPEWIDEPKPDRLADLERENFAQSDLIQKLENDVKTWKERAKARLNELLAIRAAIKQHCPEAYGQGHIKLPTSEVIDGILTTAAAVEKGRDAFRDALMQDGYKPADLAAMVETYKEQDGK